MATWASGCQLLFCPHLSLCQAEQASFFPFITVTLQVGDTVQGGFVPSTCPVSLRVFRLPPHFCFSPRRMHKQGPLSVQMCSCATREIRIHVSVRTSLSSGGSPNVSFPVCKMKSSEGGSFIHSFVHSSHEYM